ncbi:uncharacterized protein LOC144632577 isoform X2 [Oculina patagonica]
MHQVAEISLVLIFLVAGTQSYPLDELSTTRQPATPGCSPPSCLHESKCYADGQEISQGIDGRGWCYGLLCSQGQKMAWDNFNCNQTTTTQPTPRPTTATPTTYTPTFTPTTPGCPPPSCLYESKCYGDGEEISRGSDGRGWCYGLLCSQGVLLAWDNFNCFSTTSMEHLITTKQPTTPGCPPPSCLHESKCYADEEEISQGSDGRGWCFGLLCSQGQSVAWDDFNCGPTTTLPPTTIPSGCYDKGVWYPRGSEISRGTDGKGWCYGKICGDDGQMQYWDNFNCGQTTTTQLTPRPTTATPITYTPTYTPTRSGCYYNGIWYPPNSDISKGSDGNGWCYGLYCDHDGGVMAWDDWNCGPSTTTETTSTAPTPTPTPLGCLQNGIWYPAGSDISRGSDGEGWCYGEYCTHDGKLQLWDDFNCTTTQPTTLPTSLPKGCYYEGKWRSPGIFEDTDVRGCRYGAQCGMDGTVTRWEEFNCQM